MTGRPDAGPGVLERVREFVENASFAGVAARVREPMVYVDAATVPDPREWADAPAARHEPSPEREVDGITVRHSTMHEALVQLIGQGVFQAGFDALKRTFGTRR